MTVTNPVSPAPSAVQHHPHSQIPIRFKKALVQRINELDGTAHDEIFIKLNNHQVPHSHNNNGVFVNLSNVPDHVVQDIDAFVTYCSDNMEHLNEYDNKINACKLHQQYDVMKLLGKVNIGGGENAADESLPQLPAAEATAAVAAQEENVTYNLPDTALEESGTFQRRKISTKFAAAHKRYSKRKGGVETHTTKKSASDAADMNMDELSPE